MQVFPNGQAIAELKDGSVHEARWNTDGSTVTVFDSKTKYAVPISRLSPTKGIPAGARFGVRLTQELSSLKTHEGDTVKTVSITPVVVDGEILIPKGSIVEGTVVKANNVGWGFKHETASLTIKWTKATTTDGHTLDMNARVFAVENAQEKLSFRTRTKGSNKASDLTNRLSRSAMISIVATWCTRASRAC